MSCGPYGCSLCSGKGIFCQKVTSADVIYREQRRIEMEEKEKKEVVGKMARAQCFYQSALLVYTI